MWVSTRSNGEGKKKKDMAKKETILFYEKWEKKITFLISVSHTKNRGQIQQGNNPWVWSWQELMIV